MKIILKKIVFNLTTFCLILITVLLAQYCEYAATVQEKMTINNNE